MIDKQEVKARLDIEDVAREYGITFDEKGWGSCCFPEKHNNGDANPSLQINRAKQRITCWSQGCFGETGVDVIGLVQKVEKIDFTTGLKKLADRAGLNSRSKVDALKPEIVATFDYLDDKRGLLFQVIRQEPGPKGSGKTFKIRRPDGQGDWIWKMKGVRWVPYHLPDLLASTGTVVVVEGEKCADALISLGFTATTNPCGAGKWRAEFSSYMKGRDVILWPDRDPVGREHMQKVAQSLAGCASSVRIVEPPEDLPDRGDVFDGINTLGWDRDQVQAIMDDAYPWDNADKDKDIAEWPEPQSLPDALPPVDSFEPALLPEAFRPWITDIADRMQCPIDFPAVGAMVALATVVGRQVAIRPRRLDDWAVVPNLWGAVVGRPGLLKTPALSESRRPLDALGARAREEYESAMCDHQAGEMVDEEMKKKAKRDIAAALKRGSDAQGIARDAIQAETPPPVRRRYMVNDATVEKLGEILHANPRGILLFRDELVGFLRTMDREGHESDRAFYLESWNGSDMFSYDRIGRGTIDIDAACVSILGGIQPGPWSVYLSRAARGGGGDDGLVQRFQMVVWPDLPGEWRDVDNLPDALARQRAFAVFERLDSIDPVAIGAEIPPEGGLPFLRFTSTAQEIFIEWRSELERRLRGDDLSPLLEGHLAKYRSLIPTLALLIHLADVGRGPVGKDALVRACAWGEYLESHALRLYAPALSPAGSTAQALAKRILKGDLGMEFPLSKVQQRGWSGLRDGEEIKGGLALLESMDWLRYEKIPTKGRPMERYFVNPRLFGAMGAAALVS